jgi:hypothetical protein
MKKSYHEIKALEERIAQMEIIVMSIESMFKQTGLSFKVETEIMGSRCTTPLYGMNYGHIALLNSEDGEAILAFSKNRLEAMKKEFNELTN